MKSGQVQKMKAPMRSTASESRMVTRHCGLERAEHSAENVLASGHNGQKGGINSGVLQHRSVDAVHKVLHILSSLEGISLYSVFNMGIKSHSKGETLPSVHVDQNTVLYHKCVKLLVSMEKKKNSINRAKQEYHEGMNSSQPGHRTDGSLKPPSKKWYASIDFFFFT